MRIMNKQNCKNGYCAPNGNITTYISTHKIHAQPNASLMFVHGHVVSFRTASAPNLGPYLHLAEGQTVLLMLMAGVEPPQAPD